MISVFILSYNIPDKLLHAVASLLAQPEVTEILILDNASTQPMQAALDQIAQQCNQAGVACTLEVVAKGISYSAGQNWGLERAQNEFVLLMNNDAFIRDAQALGSSLKLLMRDDRNCIVGHKILRSDGSLDHCGMFFSQNRTDTEHFGRGQNPGAMAYRIPLTHVAVTGACMLVRRTHRRFDPHYWFECEDVDFCLQHILDGQRVLCNPGCIVIHDEKTTRLPMEKSNSNWQERRLIGRKYFGEQWHKRRWRLRWLSSRDYLLECSHHHYQFMHLVTNITAIATFLFFFLASNRFDVSWTGALGALLLGKVAAWVLLWLVKGLLPFFYLYKLRAIDKLEGWCR